MLVAVLRAMRPRQWLKNVLVVAAPLAAGRLLEAEVAVATLVAFVAFSLVASALYLVNDVVDAEADRQHPQKRLRPVASGVLAPAVALAVAVVLASTGFVVAMVVARSLAPVLAVYLVISLAYTAGLKHQPVLDLAFVAAGFVLRAVGGGVAAGVVVSEWLLLTAAAGALFVVAGKRFSELVLVGEGNVATRTSLRAYSPSYLRFVWSAAATVAMATAALWASDVAVGFARPALAQASVAPLVLGLLRYAWWVDRGQAEAPERVILGDRILLGLGLLWLAMFALGSGAIA
jgi:decaprenyl-phosphate phosphoribosyltransferase